MKNINKLMLLASMLCIYPLVSDAAVTKIDEYFGKNKLSASDRELTKKCRENPDDPACLRINCPKTPDAEKCKEYCEKNPATCHPKDPCAVNPNSKDCKCKKNPHAEGCDISTGSLCRTKGYNVSIDEISSGNLDYDCLDSNTITISGTKCYKYKYDGGKATFVGDFETYKYTNQNCTSSVAGLNILSDPAPDGSMYKCEEGKKLQIPTHYKYCACPNGYTATSNLSVNLVNEYFNNGAMQYTAKVDAVDYYYNNSKKQSSVVDTIGYCYNASANCKDGAIPMQGKSQGMCELSYSGEIVGESAPKPVTLYCRDDGKPQITVSASAVAIGTKSAPKTCFKNLQIMTSFENTGCDIAVNSGVTVGVSETLTVPGFSGDYPNNRTQTYCNDQCTGGHDATLTCANGQNRSSLTFRAYNGSWVNRTCYSCDACTDGTFDEGNIHGITVSSGNPGTGFVQDGCVVYCDQGYIKIFSGNGINSSLAGSGMTVSNIQDAGGSSTLLDSHALYTVNQFGNSNAALACAIKTGCAEGYTNGVCNVNNWKSWFAPNN